MGGGTRPPTFTYTYNVRTPTHTHTQAFCWVAQFVGHGVFEGRAPALLDNLFQAFFMAPVFVLLEVS